MNIQSIINITLINGFNDIIIEKIDRLISNEIIGTQVDYNLHEYSVDIKSYVNTIESNFIHKVEIFNEYDEIINLIEKNETTSNSNITIYRRYKN